MELLLLLLRSSDLAASAAFFMSAVRAVHSCLLSAIFLIVSRSFCDVREMLRIELIELSLEKKSNVMTIKA